MPGKRHIESRVKSKLAVLVSSQLYALRRRRQFTQQTLAHKVGMRQSRIAALEMPGATNPSLSTLARIAAAYGLGMRVEFLPFEKMVEWENSYSQDAFDPRTSRSMLAKLNASAFDK